MVWKFCVKNSCVSYRNIWKFLGLWANSCVPTKQTNGSLKIKFKVSSLQISVEFCFSCIHLYCENSLTVVFIWNKNCFLTWILEDLTKKKYYRSVSCLIYITTMPNCFSHQNLWSVNPCTLKQDFVLCTTPKNLINDQAHH